MTTLEILIAARDMASRRVQTGEWSNRREGRGSKPPLDLVTAVTDAYWTEHSMDIAHEPETKRAHDLHDVARRELFGRAWTTSNAEDLRVLERAVEMEREGIASHV